MALQLRTKLINEKKQHGLNASICFKIKDLIILERDQVSILLMLAVEILLMLAVEISEEKKY